MCTNIHVIGLEGVGRIETIHIFSLVPSSQELLIRKKFPLGLPFPCCQQLQWYRGYLLLFIAQLCPTLYNPTGCSTPGFLSFTISWSLLKIMSGFMSIELVMPPNHLILCHLLLLPSIFPSIKIFSNESALHIRWSKYWTISSLKVLLTFDWFTNLTVSAV